MDFIIPILVSVLFFLAKIVEKKYIERQPISLKFLVRDSLIVFLVSIIVVFIYMNYSHTIYDFMNVITDTKTVPIVGTPEIFTDVPEF